MTFDEQRAAVVREIGLRKSVYPKFIKAGTMTPLKAAQQIAAMEAVLGSLDALRLVVQAAARDHANPAAYYAAVDRHIDAARAAAGL